MGTCQTNLEIVMSKVLEDDKEHDAWIGTAEIEITRYKRAEITR